jgi:hypothetical protein
MGNVSDKFIEKTTAHILCSIFFSENHAMFVIMWKKYGTDRQTDRSQGIIQFGACALHPG